MKTSNFINLTPHDVVLRLGGTDYVFPASGHLARVKAEEKIIGNLHGVPVTQHRYSDIEFPEDLVRGKVAIVSSMFLDAAPLDLTFTCVSPDTGKTCIREDGRVVAVTRFRMK